LIEARFHSGTVLLWFLTFGDTNQNDLIGEGYLPLLLDATFFRRRQQFSVQAAIRWDARSHSFLKSGEPGLTFVELHYFAAISTARRSYFEIR